MASNERGGPDEPIPLFSTDPFLLATPNCPGCLRQMELEGTPPETFWACPDPECGLTRLF